MEYKGQNNEVRVNRSKEIKGVSSDFVLDKVIFSNVFERDIRRIYMYRKAERLAKAIQLIIPAFLSAPSLRNRLDGIAVGLIDAAIASPASAKDALSRELLALSSILSVARVGGLLSDMNAEVITREAHEFLQEIASYEAPRLLLEEMPTLSELAKHIPDARPTSFVRSTESTSALSPLSPRAPSVSTARPNTQNSKGHETNSIGHSSRQEVILGILRSKGPSYIKDISTMIRDVSEKTIQRELQALVSQGTIQREGERRWTRYSLPA